MTLIIGVVGSTGTQEVLSLAREVGRSIRANGDVVLSGGRHDEGLQAVKVAALEGAMKAATVGFPPARMLGLLKESSTPYPRLARDDLRAAYVPTGMSDARNLLNALVADAIIALPGKAGTLSETYFAYRSGRPVVFLGWDRASVQQAIDADAAGRRRLEKIAQKVKRVFPQHEGSPAQGTKLHEAVETLVRERYRSAASPSDAVDALVRAVDETWPRRGADGVALLDEAGQIGIRNALQEALRFLEV